VNLRACTHLLMTACILALGACGPRDSAYTPQFAERSEADAAYTFGVHPLHNPDMLLKTYGPLVDHLNARLGGRRIKLVASRDYDTFNKRIAAGEFDFALPNPYQAIHAMASSYRVFGKVSGDRDFRGLILVRKSGPLRTIEDLRGRRISFPAQTAVAATMLPQHFIVNNGVRLEETRIVYVGSMESAIQSVLSGASDAAGIWPDPWRKFVALHPTEAARLEVRWQTPHLVNNALVARQSISEPVVTGVMRALEELSDTPNGRKLLASMAVKGFEPANAETYRPVRTFLCDFSAQVRRLSPEVQGCS
jgi:phosphonate transport system substrate-binding protein